MPYFVFSLLDVHCFNGLQQTYVAMLAGLKGSIELLKHNNELIHIIYHRRLPLPSRRQMAVYRTWPPVLRNSQKTRYIRSLAKWRT